MIRGENENDTKTKHPRNQDEPPAEISRRRQEEMPTHERENPGEIISHWERRQR